MLLILATRNEHKAEEIRALLSGKFQCRTLNDFPGAPAVVEDAGTFAGNATKKAVEIARWLAESERLRAEEGVFVLADDSGLEVDALNGAPGVHSARFAAVDSGADGNATDAANNAKLLRLLEGMPAEKRMARFRCVLALAPVVAGRTGSSPVCAADEAELRTQLFEGVCEGRIDFGPRGGGGFGYDPLFVPEGRTESFAELGETVKNRISHRAKAMGRFMSSKFTVQGSKSGVTGPWDHGTMGP